MTYNFKLDSTSRDFMKKLTFSFNSYWLMASSLGVSAASTGAAPFQWCTLLEKWVE